MSEKKYVVVSHMGDDITVETEAMCLENAIEYKEDFENRNADNPEVYFTIEEVIEVRPRCAGKSFTIKEEE